MLGGLSRKSGSRILKKSFSSSAGPQDPRDVPTDGARGAGNNRGGKGGNGNGERPSVTSEAFRYNKLLEVVAPGDNADVRGLLHLLPLRFRDRQMESEFALSLKGSYKRRALVISGLLSFVVALYWLIFSYFIYQDDIPIPGWARFTMFHAYMGLALASSLAISLLHWWTPPGRVEIWTYVLTTPAFICWMLFIVTAAAARNTRNVSASLGASIIAFNFKLWTDTIVLTFLGVAFITYDQLMETQGKICLIAHLFLALAYSVFRVLQMYQNWDLLTGTTRHAFLTTEIVQAVCMLGVIALAYIGRGRKELVERLRFVRTKQIQANLKTLREKNRFKGGRGASGGRSGGEAGAAGTAEGADAGGGGEGAAQGPTTAAEKLVIIVRKCQQNIRTLAFDINSHGDSRLLHADETLRDCCDILLNTDELFAVGGGKGGEGEGGAVMAGSDPSRPPDDIVVSLFAGNAHSLPHRKDGLKRGLETGLEIGLDSIEYQSPPQEKPVNETDQPRSTTTSKHTTGSTASAASAANAGGDGTAGGVKQRRGSVALAAAALNDGTAVDFEIGVLEMPGAFSQENMGEILAAAVPFASTAGAAKKDQKMVTYRREAQQTPFELNFVSMWLANQNFFRDFAFELIEPLLGPLQIQSYVLFNFLQSIGKTYLPNPYHNGAHGAMTCHAARYWAATLIFKSDISTQQLQRSESSRSRSGRTQSRRSSEEATDDVSLSVRSQGYDERGRGGGRGGGRGEGRGSERRSFLPRASGGTAEMELAQLLIAAACHDVGHPGYNNNFFINELNGITLLNNDAAVLEYYHCFILFRTAQQRSTQNIFKNMSHAEFLQFRKAVITLILATDMAQHFTLVSRFRTRRNAESFSLTDFEDRWSALRICMKSADLAHAFVEWDKHLDWSYRICEEFYEQGDLEVKLHRPVSPLCNRSEMKDYAKSQSGFLNFVVAPLSSELATLEAEAFIPDRSLTLGALLQQNKDRWNSCKDDVFEIPQRIQSLSCADPQICMTNVRRFMRLEVPATEADKEGSETATKEGSETATKEGSEAATGGGKSEPQNETAQKPRRRANQRHDTHLPSFATGR